MAFACAVVARQRGPHARQSDRCRSLPFPGLDLDGATATPPLKPTPREGVSMSPSTLHIKQLNAAILPRYCRVCG